MSLNEIESCGYLHYEMNKLNNLLFSLDQYKNEITEEENPETIKRLLNSINVITRELPSIKKTFNFRLQLLFNAVEFYQ